MDLSVSDELYARAIGWEVLQWLRREHPEVLSHFHGTSFSFSSPQELTAVVDGEVMRSKSFTVSLSPKKVWFFYPAGLDYHIPGG